MARLNISSLPIDQAEQKLFRALTHAFPKDAEDLARGVLARGMEYWSLKLQNASPWGARAASTLRYEDESGGGLISADESHDNAMFYNMVENGVSGWSIKDALLSGPRAKTAADGSKYATVPLRWRTPGDTKQSGSFAGTMTEDAHALAKAGKAVTSGPLKGLKRYGGEQHSQYYTFLTCAESSTGWQYPDIPATPVFDDVQAAVEKMLAGAVTNWIQAKLKELH